LFARLVAAVRRFGVAVWRRDRSRESGWSALWIRLARIATWTIRGVRVHELSLRAAALAYYTMFSIVPVLVVMLWILKLLRLIPYLIPAESVAGLGSGERLGQPGEGGNDLLREAVRAILESVSRAGHLETGIVGLGAFLYGVGRIIRHAAQALDTIAGARGRPANYRRLLGYLALLALPVALIVVSGLVHRLADAPIAGSVAAAARKVIAVVPLLKSALSVGVGVGILCLALMIFYASAARARIAMQSALVGAVVAALLLPTDLWVFVSFQIGVSRAGALESGMAAVPVFLLWAFSSWWVVLLGAQIAVAHERDTLLVHGAPDSSADLADPPLR
jgi:membrane protein